jgi:hypothetical protein
MASTSRQLPQVLADLIASYTIPRRAATRDVNWSSLSWCEDAMDLLYANQDKIDWRLLSANSAAIELLSANPDKIDWWQLSANPAAMDLICATQDKINWWQLSGNYAATDLMCAHPDKIDWYRLSTNPAAIELLCSYPDKIDWASIALNPKREEVLTRCASHKPVDWRRTEITDTLIMVYCNGQERVTFSLSGAYSNPVVVPDSCSELGLARRRLLQQLLLQG